MADDARAGRFTDPDLVCDLAVVGGGPAGLMAAEVASASGLTVHVFDAMPSVGRKFLLAGRGGLNLTHSEADAPFLARFGARAQALAPHLAAFGARELRAWADGLGAQTFVGSSGRVFPRDMKAAPLLRAWLRRLNGQGVQWHLRQRWLGWAADGALRFATAQGEARVAAAAVVLALGGGSWPRMGSDAAWVALLAERGVPLAPLLSANCGFDVRASAGQTGWSSYFAERFAGQPLKNVSLRFADFERRGEFVVTATGVEGSLIYAASSLLRDAIAAQGSARFFLDLLPDRTAAQVLAAVQHPRGARSLASHLHGRLGLQGVKLALLHEQLGRDGMHDAPRLAAAIKQLPIDLAAPRPLAEAISSAGGVRFEALDERLMLQSLPGVFCAGEMLDWEAPTGGYLLTACLATGRAAGLGAARWLNAARA
ncbi:TIGR03862 family flavoprotein [Comamonas sp. NLF-1-9]|uniref:TIGR03862 family flavoprotein n=1 Tax=Comamonas sp. NLF-1-9 TaxID=2853163 RepID=UPI001C4588E4|nr:TIGR03862 family flavoprotein [Comamonas sp. NLF-1-9]QXL83242.1 TIGR03862 family flavoprotein [Comamonas sp. NLF-1-9]